MKYGLSDEQLAEICNIIGSYPQIEEAVIYGSRADGAYKEASDVDIAIKGEKADESLASKLKFYLEEETYLPFFFDVIAYDASISAELKRQIKTKGKTIYRKGWREVKLEDVAEIIGGGTPSTKKTKYWSGDIPWLTPKDLSNFKGRYIAKGERNISKLGLHNSNAKLLPAGTVLLTTRAPVGYLAIAKNEIAVNQGFKGLIVNKHIDNVFLYYLLKRNVDYLKAHSSGTTFGELSKASLTSISFCIPSLLEQKAIAEVLSSLDDKIDLLHRQNKTLENMAQTLFQKWLIEDADEAWEEKPLTDFLDFLEGPGIRNWQYTEKGTRFINIRLIKNGEIDIKKSNFVSDEEANGRYKNFLLKEKDMVVSTSGTLGKVAIVRSYHLPLMLNTSVIRFRPKDGINYSFMYQYLQSWEFKNELESLGSGSVQKNFGPTHLKMMKMRIPSPRALSDFRNHVDNLYSKLLQNYSHIYEIETIKNTLTPKLMSGKVRTNFNFD